MSLGLAVTPEAWYKNKREWGADYNRRDGGWRRTCDEAVSGMRERKDEAESRRARELARTGRSLGACFRPFTGARRSRGYVTGFHARPRACHAS